MQLALLIDVWAAAVWRACWQSSLVAVAVWTICGLFPTMPARFRAWLWRLAVLKFIVAMVSPVFLDLPLLPAPPAICAEDESSAGFNSGVDYPHEAQSGQAQSTALSGIRQGLFFAWLMGTACGLTGLAIAWRKVALLKRRLLPLDDAPFNARAAELSALFGMRKPPALRASADNGGPMVVGVFHATIVLPADALGGLTAPEQTLALGHELAHIRRNDILWGLIAALVRSAFFFHPLAWLCERQLRFVQELAADELAMTKQRHDSVNYGELLLSIVGKIGPGREISTMSLGTAGAVKSLKWRFIALKRVNCESRQVVMVSSTFLIALVLLGLVPWRLVAAEPAAADKRPELRLAAIKIWECKKGQPDMVLSQPNAMFASGQEANIQVGSMGPLGQFAGTRIDIRPSPNNNPAETLIEVKLSHFSEGTYQVVVDAAPKILVLDGRAGKCVFPNADGSELVIEATVTPIASTDGVKEPDKR
jgi:beta-lactamase regulating signal transducer with metallopeptidase domain